jgi:hypothetical protein
MLNHGGLDARYWDPTDEDIPRIFRWSGIARNLVRLCQEPIRESGIIHCIIPTGFRRLFLRSLRVCGKKLVFHWIGTDVQTLLTYAKDGRNRLLAFYRRAASVHFADSPKLIDELDSVGIKAKLFRLLPSHVLGDLLPLPPKHAVLTYWAPARRKFYGGDIVDSLAREFGDVDFYVAGSDGAEETRLPNLHYLGFVENMEDVYKKVGILLRISEHDSLSAMVLEMLSRGRRVICNQEFPHTHFASNLDEARKSLKECLELTSANLDGRKFVREHFNPSEEARRAAMIYREVLGIPHDRNAG